MGSVCRRSACCLVILLTVLAAVPALHAQPIVEMRPETFRTFSQLFEDHLQEFRRSLQEGSNTFEQQLGSMESLPGSGESLIEELKAPKLKGGLLHNWVGAVFIPNSKVDRVLGLLTDYNRHKDLYAGVLESRVIYREGDRIKVFLRLKRKKVLTAILDTEHEAQIERRGPSEALLISRSTRINEVRDFGEKDQRLLPQGKDSGFMWGLHAYWYLQQKGDGVLAQCYTLSLSRDIPWGLNWVVGPIVSSLPRAALRETLEATRESLSR